MFAFLKRHKLFALFALFAMLFVLPVATGILRTEKSIHRHEKAVRQSGSLHPAPAWDTTQLATLPEPVQRYLRYALPEPNEQQWVTATIDFSGEYQHPQKKEFTATSATEVATLGVPGILFATKTSSPTGWARMYDFYADGQAEMMSKVLPSFKKGLKVHDNPELTHLSLQRWLMETPLFPMALLPGGPVSWQPRSASQALAVVRYHDQEARLLATFSADGPLVSFQVEDADSDPNGPYQGAGEHVLRDEYEEVEGVMLPMHFVVSRRVANKNMPFWEGRISRYQLTTTEGETTQLYPEF